MGGCRCVYRSCQNSTTVSPGLHYFHFPVRDPVRCELWIKNAQKPDFRNIEKYKLRNKVICSEHFEEKCFTNERHDRLIHSAVPTLGFEDDLELSSDPLLPENQTQASTQPMGDDNIMLIPIDEDNTKFTLPNVEFSGMSYTIFDDAVIPTSKIEEVIIKELQSQPKPKELHIKSVVKQIKNNLPTLKKAPVIKNEKHQDITQFTVFTKDNVKIDRSKYNIQSYNVTLNGDVALEPTHILPDVVAENPEQISSFQSNSETITQSNLDQNSSQSTDNISLQAKNETEYIINPVAFIENINNDVSQETEKSEEVNMQVQEQSEEKQEESTGNDNKNNINTDYIQMIRNNTKQIQLLKRLVRKQTRLNRIMLQRKQMPSYKKKLSKLDLIDSLKDCIKPSLLAILKLELLPVDDVVLSDQEEKFITDLYTENPECYNLLRTKFNWNLPTSEHIEEPQENMQCE